MTRLLGEYLYYNGKTQKMSTWNYYWFDSQDIKVDVFWKQCLGSFIPYIFKNKFFKIAKKP